MALAADFFVVSTATGRLLFVIYWSKEYGQADLTTKSPVRPDTMFQAASISKPVTAFALQHPSAS